MPSIFFLTLLIFTTPSFATTKKAKGHAIYWCDKKGRLCRRVFGSFDRSVTQLRGEDMIKDCYELKETQEDCIDILSKCKEPYYDDPPLCKDGRVNCNKESQLCGVEEPKKTLASDSRARTCINTFVTCVETPITISQEP